MNKGNLLLAQSGGATAVINASAVGVIRQAIASKAFDKVLCAHFGINGILKEDFYDVSDISETELDILARTPASAFGSCRYKLPPIQDNAEVYANIAETTPWIRATKFPITLPASTFRARLWAFPKRWITT